MAINNHSLELRNFNDMRESNAFTQIHLFSSDTS